MISLKKTCGKTTTEMGRKHHEGLHVAAECKRTEETGISGGGLWKRPWADAVCRATE
jgi:hypothetical protein